jgi:hypothetical protein
MELQRMLADHRRSELQLVEILIAHMGEAIRKRSALIRHLTHCSGSPWLRVLGFGVA